MHTRKMKLHSRIAETPKLEVTYSVTDPLLENINPEKNQASRLLKSNQIQL